MAKVPSSHETQKDVIGQTTKQCTHVAQVKSGENTLAALDCIFYVNFKVFTSIFKT